MVIKHMAANGASDSSFSSNELPDHKIIKAPRDLTRSLVLPPTQSRMSNKVGSGCSGMYPSEP